MNILSYFRNRKKRRFESKFNKNPYKYFKNKEMSKWASIPRKQLVNIVFKFYLTQIATEIHKEEFSSANYIYWITNNLVGMYQNDKTDNYDSIINKFIEGPSYNLDASQINEFIVKKTHIHVRELLMKLPEKDLYTLIGVGLCLH